MEPNDLQVHLSALQTQWTMLFRANQEAGDAVVEAQKVLLLRYYGAVYRYLVGTLRDAAAAEELTQDFAVRFLRGDFHRANPERGRFRDFVKTALRHLAMDYWRKKEKAPAPLQQDAAEARSMISEDERRMDRPFMEKWREELLSRAWEELAETEKLTGQPYFVGLRAKAEQPRLRSAQLAELLSAKLGKSYSETNVRQLLHRARKEFAQLLVTEVGRSLQCYDRDQVEQELVALELLDYCKSALEERESAS
jgi:RNA polymerase sigma factor (sigma-70 family)